MMVSARCHRVSRGREPVVVYVPGAHRTHRVEPWDCFRRKFELGHVIAHDFPQTQRRQSMRSSWAVVIQGLPRPRVGLLPMHLTASANKVNQVARGARDSLGVPRYAESRYDLRAGQSVPLCGAICSASWLRNRALRLQIQLPATVRMCYCGFQRRP